MKEEVKVVEEVRGSGSQIQQRLVGHGGYHLEIGSHARMLSGEANLVFKGIILAAMCKINCRDKSGSTETDENAVGTVHSRAFGNLDQGGCSSKRVEKIQDLF